MEDKTFGATVHIKNDRIFSKVEKLLLFATSQEKLYKLNSFRQSGQQTESISNTKMAELDLKVIVIIQIHELIYVGFAIKHFE